MNGFNLSDIQDAKLGTTQLSSIYLRSTELWSDGPHYERQYLTIESLENGNTVSIKSQNSTYKTIQWSTDGTTWTSVTSSTSGELITTLDAGDKLYLKGNNNSYGAMWSVVTKIIVTKSYNLYGNIKSLVYGDNFNVDTFPNSGDCTFWQMFRDTPVIDASNLILPTQLRIVMYSNMFAGCTSLIAPPELPATTTVYQCYNGMFNGCTSLAIAPLLRSSHVDMYSYQGMFMNTQVTSITTYAEELGTDGFKNWLYGVPASGTFTKKATMTLFPEGASGIPSGWTVIDV